MRGRFEVVSGELGPIFQEPMAARGAAAGDLDNDGDVDMVVYRNAGAPLILRNEGSPGAHWLFVQLQGAGSNHDGIGAKLHLVAADGSEQWVTVSAAGSYLPSRDRRAHFGLGTNARVKLLEIVWPSGREQTLQDIRANQILEVREPLK